MSVISLQDKQWVKTCTALKSVINNSTDNTLAGVYKGGPSHPNPHRGGHLWWALLILHLLAFPFLRQVNKYLAGNLHSTLHCIALTRTKRLRKEIKYSLIHNNALQSFVWSSIALNIHVFHFKNWLFHFWFLYKIDLCILIASETMKKWRFQRYIGHAT